jgi:prevent-host-death family protein
MLKKISALKARQNLGQIMNEVSLRGDDYVIERAGKPLVAIIAMEKYQRLQEDQDAAFQALRNIWQKMEGVEPKAVGQAIETAIQATRQLKKKPRG